MANKKNDKEAFIRELAKFYDVKSMQDIYDAIKDLTKGFIQDSLKEELTDHLGYEKWDQDSRTNSDNYRNGYSGKKLISSNGNLDVKIPRDSNGTFEPHLVKKYEKDISEIERKIIYMYSCGNSTRQIHDQMYEIYGININKDLVTKITDKILPKITEWQNSRLQKVYPFVFIDGIRFKVKENNIFIEKTVYIVLGINCAGNKEILGFWINESESAKYWLTVFSEIKSRGVEDILILASDNLKGITESIKAAFPNTLIQKCVVHQIRNSIKFVRYDHLKEFTSDMKKIYKANSISEAETALDELETKWGKLYAYAIKSWRSNFDELATFMTLPVEIRKVIYTTNIIENINRNIRKITKTKGGFSEEKALTKLIYLALQNLIKQWRMPIHNWGLILNQLDILFENRLKL